MTCKANEETFLSLEENLSEETALSGHLSASKVAARAARARMLAGPRKRSLLWFLQALSLRPGEIKTLAAASRLQSMQRLAGRVGVPAKALDSDPARVEEGADMMDKARCAAAMEENQ